MRNERPTREHACPPSLNKRRSRRLRKKLRVGEFREDGFAVRFRFVPGIDHEARGEVLWRFITAAVEPRALRFGGGEHGFVTRAGRGSTSEEDRAAVRAWLVGCGNVTDVVVGPNEDAWYGTTSG